MRSQRAIHLVAAAVLAFTGATVPLFAQRAVYSRAAGDTVRFRDVTKMDGVAHEAAGDAVVTFTRESSVAFAFSGGESVTAWFNALVVEASGPLGGAKQSSDSILHAPFLLQMEANGRIQTLHTPTFPRSMRLLAELPPQFDDFFPRLPSDGRALKIGTAWIDTVSRVQTDTGGRHLSIRRISSSRVVRDSSVDGKPVIVISIHLQNRIESAVPMQQKPYVADLALTGEEDGFAVFSVVEGRLIARERSGETHGAVTYRGGDAPWVVNQSYKYHRTVVAIESGGGRAGVQP